jgi:hypothetical protein
MAAFIAAILAGLTPSNVEAIELDVPNNSSSIETVFSNQEFNQLGKNSQQVILAKAEGGLMPLPPAAINRLYHSAGSKIGTNKNYPQLASIPASKVDKIRLTNDQMKQFNNLALQLNTYSVTT